MLTGDVRIRATSFTEGDADAKGIALAAGVSGGSSVASVNENSQVDARTGTAVRIVTDGSIEMRARHNEQVNIYDGTFDAMGDVVTDDPDNHIMLPGNHGLSTGDRVTYRNLDETTIGGLVNEKSYAVIVLDAVTVRLGEVFEAENVDALRDVISFEIAHGLENGQRVFYGDGGNAPIAGLAPDHDYFVFVVDEFTIKLYDSLADVNAVGSSFAPGADVDEVTEEITVANHMFIQDQPLTYLAPDSRRFAGNAVEVAGDDDDVITLGSIAAGNQGGQVDDHGFLTGDHVTYRADGLPVGGLADGADYYVIRVGREHPANLRPIRMTWTSTIVDISNPDDPDDPPSTHFLSMFHEVPLAGLADTNTYYADVVDVNTVRSARCARRKCRGYRRCGHSGHPHLAARGNRSRREWHRWSPQSPRGPDCGRHRDATPGGCRRGSGTDRRRG